MIALTCLSAIKADRLSGTRALEYGRTRVPETLHGRQYGVLVLEHTEVRKLELGELETSLVPLKRDEAENVRGSQREETKTVYRRT